MARHLSASLQAALDGDGDFALLYTFEFGTGTYGLWTGASEISYNGLVYRDGGSLIELDLPKQSVDGSVSRMTMKLSTHEDKGLTEDVLVRLYEEDWHNKIVLVQIARVNPAFTAVLDSFLFFRGRMEEAPYFPPRGSPAAIVARCVSTSIDLSKSGGLFRNDATQRDFDPTDSSMLGIGSLNGAIHKDFKWGQG